MADRLDPLFAATAKIDLQFDYEALLALASPSVPLAAAERAIDLATDGKHITREEADELIAQARADESAAGAMLGIGLRGFPELA